MQPIKISNELVLAMAVILVGLLSVANLLMLQIYAGRTQEAIGSVATSINPLNDTYKSQVGNYLTYLRDSVAILSQSVNLTSEDNLKRISTIEESNMKLRGAVDNLTDYISKLNLTANYTCTNTTIIYNQTQQIPVQQSCRQWVIERNGLGLDFDIVYCCESRSYGFSDECCSCYR